MSFEVVILDDYVKDVGDAWIFPYNGKGYVEMGDIMESIPGNTPVRVEKVSGVVGFR
jgi:hypothetical protein